MWGAIKKAINSNLNKSLDVLITEKHSETNSKIDSRASQGGLTQLALSVNNVKLDVLKISSDIEKISNNIKPIDIARLNKTILFDGGSSRAIFNLPLNVPIYAIRLASRSSGTIGIPFENIRINGVDMDFFSSRYLDGTRYLSTDNLDILAFAMGGELMVERDFNDKMLIKSFIIKLNNKVFTAETKLDISINGTGTTTAQIFTEK